jgi:hypothetical protein
VGLIVFRFALHAFSPRERLAGPDRVRGFGVRMKARSSVL